MKPQAINEVLWPRLAAHNHLLPAASLLQFSSDILGPVFTSSKVVQGWQGGPIFLGHPVCPPLCTQSSISHLQPHHFGGLSPPLPEVRRSAG